MLQQEIKRSKSLEEVNASVDTTQQTTVWRRLFAFLGPAYLVSVGYMDPGNWATDIAGGSQFGYKLLWVLLMSNLMAILLQSLSARLGVVRGLDLAQASRETYPPFINVPLYFLAEIAIAACDLAEVLGMAIGLQLLFGIPLVWGVSITVLDTFLLLFLINKGMRKMEAFVLALVIIIGGAFVMEMFFAKPDAGELLTGLIPSIPNNDALYIAIGIIGATVMPHNLYLHSSLVQSRKIERTPKGIWQAIKYNFIDSAVALNLAFFVNAAILILAAAAFYKNGIHTVTEIQDAHQFLAPILGNKWAPILFAVALIAAGQSSTLTGTLAGQIVMEGYLNLRIQPWLRRMLTRLLAVGPALFVILYFGEDQTGELLVLSQVILSLQLGFAVIPLIHFVSNKNRMGEFVIGTWLKLGAWLIAATIVTLNAKLVVDQIIGWFQEAENPVWLWIFVVPLTLACAALLLYITFQPLFVKSIKEPKAVRHHQPVKYEPEVKPRYQRIAITLDFSEVDKNVLDSAMAIGGVGAEYLLIHIVETAGALVLGQEIRDMETSADGDNLKRYADDLRSRGYDVRVQLGFGSPKQRIPKLVKAFDADLLVMGSHGHKMVKDLILGTTIDAVRHAVKIPLLIV
ncbi:Nramp family divalent metal transporter [Pontibacter akesuensis]|uniref:Divalent metal cation transporter MntH n=1 Tax=Pontibacter akesuensis TaxID=388950 RepID=A0A1I7FVR5_9BACT|nr:Nramp family divalent metal transporter [Pontibacter akesuensis]GHA60248.1 divalent metal cation transporter MntH [Pontibacter akesuensis]SFU40314.1 manganese transport protein [Pontibacter akesuensis]